MAVKTPTIRVVPMSGRRARRLDGQSGERRESWPRIHTAFTDFRTRFARRRSRGELADSEREIFSADTPPEVTSVRAKSSRHGKSTADKWNQ
jgi:hypothetical protein